MRGSEQRDPKVERSDWDLVSLLVGIVAGAMVLGAVWLLVASITGDTEQDESPTVTDPRAVLGETAGPAAQVVEPTGLERCVRAVDVLDVPLAFARPAMDQWAVHVGAMNKLVVGAITLPQATAFWNQTRVGAYRRIARFKDADSEVEQQGVDCPAPRLLGADAAPELVSCARRVAAELQALRNARAAISTWNDHMRDMDQLRAGTLSPTAATKMWLSMWQRGVHEL